MNKKPIENDGRHLFRILMATTCNKHGAEEGMPCFAIFPDTSQTATLSGACGERIRHAGFNGKITPTSFQTSRANKDTRYKSSYKKKEKDAA